MKKYLSTLLSLTLVLSLLLCLAGCGGGDEKKLEGTWNAELDLTDALNEGIAGEDPEIGEYIHVDSSKLNATYTFNSDGTYSTVIDEDSINAWYEGLTTDLTAGFMDYFGAMAQEEGLDMDAEEMLAMMGFSIEDLLDEALDKDSLLEGLDAEEKGTYEIKDGKLICTDEDEGTSTYTYEFKSDTELVFTDLEEADEDVEFLLPMTLTKQ